MSSEFWDRRYATEGAIWGSSCSETCHLLLQQLSSTAKIFEVGFGYGRDIMHLRRLGYEVGGTEQSIQAMQRTIASLQREGFDYSLGLSVGQSGIDFIDITEFDALLSHRTLHLFNDQQLDVFFSAIRRMQRDSIIAVSARDDRNFDSEQMKMIQSGVAEYIIPGRTGHRISFWSPARFSRFFGEFFDTIEIKQAEEPEALGNTTKQAQFTIFLGRRNDRQA